MLWDLDASDGAGFMFALDPDRKRHARSLFAGDVPASRLIEASSFARLDVLPADTSLRDLGSLLLRLGSRQRLAALSRELAREYERVILDCPPMLNELSAQVMRAASVVIVPVPPSPLSARAFHFVVDEIRQHTRRAPPILPLLSMIDRRRALHCEAITANPAWPVIPMMSALEQCAVRQQPVGSFAPRSPAASAFQQLWSGIEHKLAQLDLAAPARA